MRSLLIILLLYSFTVSSQDLLVNGDFEEDNICSEYKVNCAPEAWLYTVPSFIYYFKDNNGAYSGKHYIALIAGHSKKPYYRTYVRSRLLCGLKKGNTYRLQLYIKSTHPVLDSIGVYFSNYDFLYERAPVKIKPSLYLDEALRKPVKGDTGWQQIIIDYTATGEEVFLTLGNFRKADITGNTGIDKENNFFVLFDKISMTPLNKNEVLCADWIKRREDIYQEDERHEYQTKLMKLYSKNPPKLLPGSSNRILHVDTLIVPDVLFATGRYDITKTAKVTLDSFILHIQKLKIDSILVFGHTDSRGTDDINKELSWRRASTVASYLQQAVSVKTISRGAGSERPIATNRTPEGRQKNRRVEILVYKQE